MSLFKSIIKAIRGAGNEVGEAVVDANALRIFEQEIRDMTSDTQKAREALTTIIAKQRQMGRDIESLNTEIARYSEAALKADQAGKGDLALEAATKVGSLEKEKAVKQEAYDAYAAQVTKQKGYIKSLEAKIEEYQRELEMAKTRETVHNANKAVTESLYNGGGSAKSARESFERVQKRQQENEDKLDAAIELDDEFSGGGLDKRLAEAGIGDSAEEGSDILARLKAGSN